MVAKESLQVVEEYTDFQDPEEEEEEGEETLSLCDLPIHNDSFKWEDESFSKLDHEGRSSFENDDFFEFFSEDFTASTYNNPTGKDIIFCGKLIPYKEPPLLHPDHHHHHHQQQQTQNHHHHHHHHQKTSKKPTKKSKRFQWKSYSFHKLVIKSSSKGSKNGENYYNSSKPQKVLKNSKTLSLPNKSSSNKNLVYKTSKSDVSLGKVSVLSSSPAKSRWYLFMFGIVRLPTPEMELRDIKTRQSRRSPSTTMFSLFEEERRGDHHQEIVKEKVVKRKRSGKGGLWGLIRALGCTGSLYTNAVVQGSFGYNMPEVPERY